MYIPGVVLPGILKSMGILKGAGRVAVGEGDIVNVPGGRVARGDLVIVVARGELVVVLVCTIVRVGVESADDERLTKLDLEKLGEADEDLDAEEHAELDRVAARTSVLDIVMERKVERVIVERGESDVDRTEERDAVDENVGREDLVARDAEAVRDMTDEAVDDFDTAPETVGRGVRVGLTVRVTDCAAENEMDERTDRDTVFAGADRVTEPEPDLTAERELDRDLVTEPERELERVKLKDAVPLTQAVRLGVAETERVTIVDRDGLGVKVLRLDCVFVLEAEFVDVEDGDLLVDPDR